MWNFTLYIVSVVCLCVCVFAHIHEWHMSSLKIACNSPFTSLFSKLFQDSNFSIHIDRRYDVFVLILFLSGLYTLSLSMYAVYAIKIPELCIWLRPCCVFSLNSKQILLTSYITFSHFLGKFRTFHSILCIYISNRW